jgi:hypothetical protein
LVFVAVSAVVGGFAVLGAFGPPYGNVRATVAFIGDSNIVFGFGEISTEMTPSEIGYVPINLAAARASIRWNGCRKTGVGPPCPDPGFTDYWKVRIPQVVDTVEPDAFVVALGINDAGTPGTATTTGYSGYDGKIDYLMRLLPRDRPVRWTNLPCSLEPAHLQAGCEVINAALARAPARWPNLRIVDWARTAAGHVEFMRSFRNDVHYSAAGHRAYARVVIRALDARFP